MTAPAAQQANPFVAFIERYRDDPVGFVQEVLNVEPDEWQAEFLRAIARGDRRISVRSGHGVGKSTAASWAAIWYHLTRFPVKVVITAPTKPQLFDALFAELKGWVRALPDGLRDLLDEKTDRIALKAAPTESFISARTSRADTPEALAGVHSENVMLIGDEASGIPEQVFEAAAGSMSGESAVTLLLGNPVRSSGYFFETHHKLAEHWTTFHVSCVRSSRVSREWVEEMRVKYGELSNAFRIRVLGEFPAADDDTIIPYSLIASSLGRDVTAAPTTGIVWGIDPARFGSDATGMVKRHGRVLLEPPRLLRGLDLMQLAAAVEAEYRSTDPKRQPAMIFVDAIGLGAGLVDRLRQLGLPVRGVNVSEVPSTQGVYLNLRAELWFKLKDWFAGQDVALPALEGLTGPERESMERLISDLASVKYAYAPGSQKIKIESKKEMKDRMGHSPDAADALVLTFAAGAANALFGRDGSVDWNRPIKRNLTGVV